MNMSRERSGQSVLLMGRFTSEHTDAMKKEHRLIGASRNLDHLTFDANASGFML